MNARNVREGQAWSRGYKQTYTDRQLTEEERAFSADAGNYSQLFKYMGIHKLDQEEWYDILIIPYLQSVKKYFSIPELQQYSFTTILIKMLDTARGNHYRAMHAQKRMPEGGFVSLDYVMEDDRVNHGSRMEAWWEDRKASVERQVIFKEMFSEFYEGVCNDVFSSVADHDKWLIDMILDGYEMKEIVKEYESRYGKCDADDWWETIDYINYALNGRIRMVFRKAFGI